VVQVVVALGVLLGMAALAFDVGAMYNTKADMQRSVDAAALAAASMLAQYDAGDPLQLARTTAEELRG
jgi:Flp pilus assembly protein TadG